MKFLKSYFWYNKHQRNRILFLIVIIVILQILFFYINTYSSNKVHATNSTELIIFQKRIDRLKRIQEENEEPKIFPFNPNYITDFKGYKLGMSIEQIDRLHAFREQGKWINTIKKFKEVTKVSDSLCNVISPYFKFPDWITKNTGKKTSSTFTSAKNKTRFLKSQYSIKTTTTTNINKASAEDLATIKGIGEKLSQRIIKYRKKLQGFTYDYQLYEVWNIDSEVIASVLKTFSITSKPKIQKVNINEATFKEVLKNPYIDYALCKKIFEYKNEVAELQNISEIKKIEGFPLSKYDRITLYLEAK